MFILTRLNSHPKNYAWYRVRFPDDPIMVVGGERFRVTSLVDVIDEVSLPNAKNGLINSCISIACVGEPYLIEWI